MVAVGCVLVFRKRFLGSLSSPVEFGLTKAVLCHKGNGICAFAWNAMEEVWFKGFVVLRAFSLVQVFGMR